MRDILKERFSVRQYLNKQISKKDLEAILEAIRIAPTWKNKQCFEVIVIDDKKIQTQIGDLVKFNPSESSYFDASHLLIFVANPYKSGYRDNKSYYLCDCANAISNATYKAFELGLGCCWVGVFPEDKLKEFLHIPDELKIVALLPLGYPNEEHQTSKRRNINEFVYYNKYDNPNW